ncbi:MAG: ABC transporter permease [Deltaproteobacteria bacterium]|nr:MAG: ABC transporter permease [Deltaproteobacteria bacterium]
MTTFIANIGRVILSAATGFYTTLTFASRILLTLFDKRTYNSASRMVFINQIYFTSIQILPLFLFVAAIFGSLINGMVFQVIKDLGLNDLLGRLLMGFVVIEVSPFVTVLLIALRSSSAINAEIAVMKVNRELQTLESFNIDLIHYLFIPRIVNVMISMVLLTGLFSLVILSIGLLVSSVIFGTSIEFYIDTLLSSADLRDIIVLIVKCAVFGFFITLIPIRLGLSASQELTSIPISVLNGMVKVFVSIIIIEVLSLIVRFI